MISRLFPRRRKPKPRRIASRRTLAVEALEPRHLLAATVVEISATARASVVSLISSTDDPPGANRDSDGVPAEYAFGNYIQGDLENSIPLPTSTIDREANVSLVHHGMGTSTATLEVDSIEVLSNGTFKNITYTASATNELTVPETVGVRAWDLSGEACVFVRVGSDHNVEDPNAGPTPNVQVSISGVISGSSSGSIDSTINGSSEEEITFGPGSFSHSLTGHGVDADICVRAATDHVNGATTGFDASALGRFTIVVNGPPAPLPEPFEEHVWSYSGPGEFEDLSNWDTAIVPTDDETAIFNVKAVEEYEVDFNQDEFGGTTLVIDGANPKFDLNGNTYYVSHIDGSGLFLDDGADLKIKDGTVAASQVTVGQTPGQPALIDLRGRPNNHQAVLTAGSIVVGDSSGDASDELSGILKLRDGGAASSTTDVTVGAGGKGKTEIAGVDPNDGQSSILLVETGSLSIADNQSGTVSVSDGGIIKVDQGNVNLGSQTDPNRAGELTVEGIHEDGTRSTVNSDAITVGRHGKGTLQVLGGALVTAEEDVSSIGTQAPGAGETTGGGEVIVDGVGTTNVNGIAQPVRSHLTTQILSLGDESVDSGDATLTISDGGAANAELLVISSTQSAVTVEGVHEDSGLPSRLTSGSLMLFEGIVNVRDGAELAVTGLGTVGSTEEESSLVIEGVDSETLVSTTASFDTLQSTSQIEVRDGAQLDATTVSVYEGGDLKVTGQADGVVASGLAADRLEIGFAGDFTMGGQSSVHILDGAAATVANRIVVGSPTDAGDGILNVSQTDLDQERPQLTTTDLLVGSEFSKGFLILNGGDVIADGLVTINTNGILGGSGGTVNGNTVNDGTIAPGSSPGLLTINGDVVNDGSGVIEIEVFGPNPVTDYDVLEINGNVTLGGTLEVIFGGYVPQPGDVFNYLRATNVSEQFDEVVVEGLPPELEINLDPVAGTIIVEQSNLSLLDVARQLDDQFHFQAPANDYHNWGGLGERWLQDAAGNWYFILTDGQLYLWDLSTSATGTLIAELDASFHADLSRLYDPPRASDNGNVDEAIAAALDGQLDLYTAGDLYLNWGGLNEKWLQSETNNGSWYYITPDGGFWEWLGGSVGNASRLAEVNVSYYADIEALYNAAENAGGSDQNGNPQAAAIDAELGLHTKGNLYLNWGGWTEKWLQGRSDEWYFVLPDGRFYAWHGGTIDNSTLLYTLDAIYYTAPALLYDAATS